MAHADEKRENNMNDNSQTQSAVSNKDNMKDIENCRPYIIKLVDQIDDIKALRSIYLLSLKYYLRR